MRNEILNDHLKWSVMDQHISVKPDPRVSCPVDPYGVDLHATFSQDKSFCARIQQTLEERLGESFEIVSDSRSFGYYGMKVVTFWLDAPYAFVLRRGRKPLAVVAFYIKPEYIDIRQLQGNKGKHEILKTCRRWEQILVSVIEDYARLRSVAEVRIRPAKENGWHERNPEAFYLRYDVTAKRMGYRYDGGKRRYCKRVDEE